MELNEEEGGDGGGGGGDGDEEGTSGNKGVCERGERGEAGGGGDVWMRIEERQHEHTSLLTAPLDLHLLPTLPPRKVLLTTPSIHPPPAFRIPLLASILHIPSPHSTHFLLSLFTVSFTSIYRLIQIDLHILFKCFPP